MKRFILMIVGIMVWVLNINAQTTKAPNWIRKLPKANNPTFYYRVTVSEGKTYKDRYAEAFSKAIYESYSKLEGISVRIHSDQESIKDGVLQSISADSDIMRLPINKVCEYEEDIKTSSNKRLYVLWQVANSALVDPIYDYYDCE